jgi:ABC-type multidrug transport system fused ATPase/permease subunit
LRIEHGQVRLVIMDEPTANIDMTTDDGVQRLVRSALKNLTVITIAHRLNTVIDFDKILVMDDGQVAEYGKPLDLLANPNSSLFKTVHAMGEEAAQKLIMKAQAKLQH